MVSYHCYIVTMPLLGQVDTQTQCLIAPDPLCYTAAAAVAAAFLSLDAHHLNKLGPETDGRIHEGSLVCIYSWSLPDEVGLGRTDEAGASEQLPADEENRREKQHGLFCVLVMDGQSAVVS